MVSNEVAYYATVFKYISNTCSFWSRLFSNFTAFQILHFTSLRIVKHTVTLNNVYNVLWDVGAVSDS